MFSDNNFLFVVFTIYLFSFSGQIFYYLYFYLRVLIYRHPEVSSCKKPVSVIICARNEAENLMNFLPSVLEQDYPDYEVIVVNDCSEDNSYDILGNYLLKYPHLKVSTVSKDPKFTHNKKFAQFIGIKAAKNEILLFTDADCQPGSDKWLEIMSSRFDEGIDFVLGYGGYLREKGLLNRYIRYDTMMIGLQYLGTALSGRPYMGVGRNLAYRREVFFGNKGFGSHTHIISGDDDLFVNSHARARNTLTEFRKEAHTVSVPASSFIGWIIQKKRHFTTAPFYKFTDKVILASEPLTRVLFYTGLIILISNLFHWIPVLVLFGVRLIIQSIVFITGSKRFNEKGIAGLSLFFDIFSPVINGLIYLSNSLNRSGRNRWK